MSTEPSADVRDAYGALAHEYIELLGSTAAVHADDLELISRRLSIRPGLVLDVGCGPGHLTEHLRSLGVDAVGIDQVGTFIEHARATYRSVHFELASLEHLPVPDRSVAGVLAWYSLIHFPPEELHDVLVELRRAMATGSTLVAGFFDGESVEPFDHRVVTACRWPVDELSEQLRYAGFIEVERQQRPGVDEAGRRPHAALVVVAA